MNDPGLKEFAYERAHGLLLSRAGIVDADILQHRDEAINLIDGVINFNPNEPSITAVKVLHATDPVFNGHFPGNPVCPGKEMIEMCQLAAALLYFCLHGSINGLPVPRALDKVVFRKFARPNDSLFITVSHPKQERNFFTCSAVVRNQAGERIMTIGEIRGVVV